MIPPVLETTLVLNSNELSETAQQHPVKVVQQLDWMDLEFEGGQKVSIEIENGEVRVHAYTAENDGPVSLHIREDSVDVESRDFVDDGGVLNHNPEP